MKKLASILILLLLILCPATEAEARGRLLEMLRQRGGDEGGAGLFANEGGGGTSCAEWDAKVKKLAERRASQKMKSSVQPDLQDVAYGKQPRQKIDVYLPNNFAAPAPIIFMVHGGGWCTGDKAHKGVVEKKVARWVPKGFIFVSVNYPMVGDGSMAGTQGLDVARALAYVQQHAKEWGGDRDKVILMGHSAGAHLISLVNADSSLREKAGAAPVLGAVSLDSGAINVVTQMPNAVRMMKTRYKEAFGTDEAAWPSMSPYHMLDKNAAPWLGICGARRPDKPCEQAKEYAEKSKSLGIYAEVLPQQKNHGGINADVGKDETYTAAIEKFMASLESEVAARLRR